MIFSFYMIIAAGGCPARERDNAAARTGVHAVALLVLRGELVDGADEGWGVGAELGEFPGNDPRRAPPGRRSGADQQPVLP